MPYRSHHRARAHIVSETYVDIEGMHIRLTRKTIKNLYLRIKPSDGSITISAPVHMSIERIAEFGRVRRPWIERQREILAKSRHESLAAAAELVGEYNELRKNAELRSGAMDDGTLTDDAATDRTVVDGGVTDDILASETTVMPAQGKGDGFLDGSTAQGFFVQQSRRFEWTQTTKLQAAQRINTQLPELLGRWEPVIGRKPTHITLRTMTTRWGSCTPKTGRIRLNLQLGFMDPKFLEYVLVHEMTHLWVGGHGSEFQAHMSTYLPYWKQLRRQLNRHVVW